MTLPHTLATPHGGPLVQRCLDDDAVRVEALAASQQLTSVTLDATAEADLELLGSGGYSPLTGFMGHSDFETVLTDMRLASGLPWTIPIVLGARQDVAAGLRAGQQLALRRSDGQVCGVLTLEQVYPHDPVSHAEAVFGTSSPDHPGVQRVLQLGDVLLGGPVTVLDPPPPAGNHQYRLTPRQLRAEFARRGWNTVVAFQTRNPIHRAHEYLMKCALESTDGLLLHPIVGQTKADDLSADVRVRSYEVLLQRYFDPGRAMMALFPAAMRYAGPREAVFHAIVRKNHGCTHFIIGRDHAGARAPDGTPYYGPLEAQQLFSRFSAEEIGIHLFCYDNAFYCRQCQAVVTAKTAPPMPDSRFQLSGTAVRDLLRSGQRPPPEITRPEVADVLIEALADEQQAATAARARGL